MINSQKQTIFSAAVLAALSLSTVSSYASKLSDESGSGSGDVALIRQYGQDTSYTRLALTGLPAQSAFNFLQSGHESTTMLLPVDMKVPAFKTGSSSTLLKGEWEYVGNNWNDGQKNYANSWFYCLKNTKAKYVVFTSGQVRTVEESGLDATPDRFLCFADIGMMKGAKGYQFLPNTISFANWMSFSNQINLDGSSELLRQSKVSDSSAAMSKAFFSNTNVTEGNKNTLRGIVISGFAAHELFNFLQNKDESDKIWDELSGNWISVQIKGIHLQSFGPKKFNLITCVRWDTNHPDMKSFPYTDVLIKSASENDKSHGPYTCRIAI